MIVARTLEGLREALAELEGPVALAATMGALHAGHVALVAAGRAQAASVVASIFVNPLQFADPADLVRYPRTEEGDLTALEAAGCDVAWLPSVEVMYPGGGRTAIEVGGPAEGFEGVARPGHFRGVATVVGKLFHQVGPEVTLFGEKDWQQLQVVRRMVQDLDWPVRVVGVATVREADGLAMSSRNRFLTAGERAVAPGLYRVLRDVAAGLRAGEAGAIGKGEAALQAQGFGVEYLALVGEGTMTPVEGGVGRLVAAARLGSVRLLDNVAVEPG